MDSYEYMYKSIYLIIKAIGERSGRSIINNNVYNDEMPKINLLKLQKELKKNSTMSNEQLFKKFPLRTFCYVHPNNNASMKSVIKYTEEKRLGIRINDDVITFQTSLTDEELINNKMYMMNHFNKFLDLMKRSIVFADIRDKLTVQMHKNNKMSNDLYITGKNIMKIVKSSKSPEDKAKEVTYIINSFRTTNDERKEVIEYIVTLIAQTLSSALNTNLGDIELPTYDDIIIQIDESLTSLDTINSILSNLRMIPFNPVEDDSKICMIVEILKAIDNYFNGSLKPIYENKFLMNNCYRLMKTLHVGLVGNTIMPNTNILLTITRSMNSSTLLICFFKC